MEIHWGGDPPGAEKAPSALTGVCVYVHTKSEYECVICGLPYLHLIM